jgi:Immunoglobulin-like domain of bacterial spore germination
MRVKVAVVAALGVLAVLAPAALPDAAQLTATRIRIADHPGFVRVVVDFSGGRVLAGEVVASDPDPFPDGVVQLPLSRAGVGTSAPPVTVGGVSARISQGTGRITIRLAAAARRFKYAGYLALHGPERLAIDLYDSAPPGRAATIRRGRSGCLTLGRGAVGPERVVARGRERDLFEHTLVVRLRRRDGHVQAQRAVTAFGGRWHARFRYRPVAPQGGTLEAVALSAKDGTLDCLVQVRVGLGR